MKIKFDGFSSPKPNNYETNSIIDAPPHGEMILISVDKGLTSPGVKRRFSLG